MSYLKKKIIKISKGYRLKPSTHKIIYRIQELISGDQEMAVGNACRKYYRELILKKKLIAHEQSLKV
jgi:hypothetical protein